ncbi:A1 cistron-splicing factor [Obelidium mucronatum]|nr:A1 cistron-splicing factor [Obelidium mucronatum]
MNIDQNTAKQLLATGAFLVLLDAPVDISFGIDLNEWQTGPRFKGLKLIPPGLHFVHYSSKNSSTGETGIRTGFFKFFASKEIYVTQWDKAEEDLLDDSVLDKDQIERIKYNILQFEPNLGAYPLIPHPQQPLPTYQKWLRLTNYISQPLLSSLLPTSKKVSSLVSVSRFSDLDDSILSTAGVAAPGVEKDGDMVMEKEQQQQQQNQNLQHLVSLNIQFTPIDLKRSFPSNATPQERTKYSLDKSYLLNHVLKTFYKGDFKLLLGELQFSFILFLVGQVYDGLEQWKCLVQLLCSAKEATTSATGGLYYEFLGVLHAQLQECPEDFFVDALSSSNFLRVAIVELVSTLRDPDTVDRLPNVQMEKRVTQFVELVTERFQWDLEEAVKEKWDADETEEGEYAPMVC